MLRVLEFPVPQDGSLPVSRRNARLRGPPGPKSQVRKCQISLITGENREFQRRAWLPSHCVAHQSFFFQNRFRPSGALAAAINRTDQALDACARPIQFHLLPNAAGLRLHVPRPDLSLAVNNQHAIARSNDTSNSIWNKVRDLARYGRQGTNTTGRAVNMAAPLNAFTNHPIDELSALHLQYAQSLCHQNQVVKPTVWGSSQLPPKLRVVYSTHGSARSSANSNPALRGQRR